MFVADHASNNPCA